MGGDGRASALAEAATAVRSVPTADGAIRAQPARPVIRRCDESPPRLVDHRTRGRGGRRLRGQVKSSTSKTFPACQQREEHSGANTRAKADSGRQRANTDRAATVRETANGAARREKAKAKKTRRNEQTWRNYGAPPRPRLRHYPDYCTCDSEPPDLTDPWGENATIVGATAAQSIISPPNWSSRKGQQQADIRRPGKRPERRRGGKTGGRVGLEGPAVDAQPGACADHNGRWGTGQSLLARLRRCSLFGGTMRPYKPNYRPSRTMPHCWTPHAVLLPATLPSPLGPVVVVVVADCKERRRRRCLCEASTISRSRNSRTVPN
uniref:Uncharacterized protein n=1 Tax=Plectus sambesii TaxID=2011161 RepID=A0A914X1D4_9BILA